MSQIGQCPADSGVFPRRVFRHHAWSTWTGPPTVRLIERNQLSIPLQQEGVWCDQGVKPVQLGLPRVADLFVRHLYNLETTG